MIFIKGATCFKVKKAINYELEAHSLGGGGEENEEGKVVWWWPNFLGYNKENWLPSHISCWVKFHW